MGAIKHLNLIFAKEIHGLEYDPVAQYKFNQSAFWFWICQMPIVAFLDLRFNKFWVPISILYLIEGSLWANVATHLGGMSASLAAQKHNKKTDQILDKVSEGEK